MKSSLALLNFKCLRKALHNASLKRRKKLLHFRWWHLFMARMCSTLYLHILGNTIFSFFIILSLPPLYLTLSLTLFINTLYILSLLAVSVSSASA